MNFYGGGLMNLLGVMALVRYKERPLQSVEFWEKVGMNWNIDLTLQGGVFVAGLTFPRRAPGPDSPALIFHNHPTFLGQDRKEPCFFVGNMNALDENTQLPVGWKLVSKIKHPIFDYAHLVDADGEEVIGVGDIWDEHFKRNGQLIH